MCPDRNLRSRPLRRPPRRRKKRRQRSRMATTIDRLAHDVGQLLRFVGGITADANGPEALLASLGWDLPPGVRDIGLASVDFSSLSASLDQLQEAISSDADTTIVAARFAQLLVEVDNAFTHLRAVLAGLSATGDYLDQTRIKDEFLKRLTDLFATSRISAASPLGLLLLQCFGIITLRPFPADPSTYQVEHVRAIVDWSALPKLFTDPVGLLEARYGWGTPTFDGESLVANLSALLEAIGEPARMR